MDESFLKEHVDRCRSLADISSDPLIKKRLLALASQYDGKLPGRRWMESSRLTVAAVHCPVRPRTEGEKVMLRKSEFGLGWRN